MLLFQAESKIAGYGLFSSYKIKKGTKILQFSGDICTTQELKEKYEHEEANYAVQFHPDYYLTPTDNLDSFVNHSCDPNAGIKIKSFGNVELCAMRDIASEEEITFDYSTSQVEFWTIGCGCRAKNCRKVVESAEFLPRKRALYYFVKGFMPWYAFKSSMVDALFD